MLAQTVMDKSMDERLQRLKHTVALRFLHKISKLLKQLHDGFGVDRQLINNIFPDEKLQFVDLVLWRRGKHVLSIWRGEQCVFQDYLWVECQNCGEMLLSRYTPHFSKTFACWNCGELLAVELAYDRMVASWP